MNALVFDLESVAIDGAADYLEPAKAPGNYKDEAKIAEYIALANAEALAKAALDVDLGRIVAIGWNVAGNYGGCGTAKNESEEHKILSDFWHIAGLMAASRPTLVGFNCLAFDLPLLLRRSLYLGVDAPRLTINKYRHDGIEDLMLRLSYDGALRYRSLSFYAKRFGLDAPTDPHSGADIAALVAAGEWEAVAAHCRADVNTTVALARRIGVL